MNKLEIKKIPLKQFIETLMEIYDSGLDYVNMVVEKKSNQDHIWFIEEPPKQPPMEITNDVNFEELL